MTRFARAKGSKASNERLPEDATSWTEMKEQLQRTQKESEVEAKRNEIMAKRAESYNQFLNEQQKDTEKKVEWADFSDMQLIQSFKKNKAAKDNLKNWTNKTDSAAVDKQSNVVKNKKIKRKLDSFESEENLQNNGVNNDNSKIKISNDKWEETNEENVQSFKKNNHNKKNGVDNKNVKTIINNNECDETNEENVQSFKKKNHNQNNRVDNNNAKGKIDNDESEETNNKPSKRKKRKGKSSNNENDSVENLDGEESSQFPMKKKRKTYMLPELTPYEELSEAEKLQVDKKKARRARQLEKRKLIKQRRADEPKPGDNSEGGENTTKKNNQKGKNGENSEGNKKKDKAAKKKAKVALPKKIPYEELSEAEKLKVDKKKAKYAKQLEKRKKFKEMKKAEMEIKKNENKESENTNIETTNDANETRKFSKPLKPKTPPKDKTGKEPKRKKPLPETQKIEINGKLTEITYMDGFPVLKEDAENLKELKESMVKKGLPRSEINAAMKLARRRAEKNLARKKRNVCFNCRQSGHVLSECPNLAQEENTIGSGVCFKCGSTEHTHFQCKVVRNQEFKFATCFICKEQGHISKQCPDNAKGLYPKGGACKLCGDVTHLKKDCPKRLAEIESNNFGLDRIGDDIEGLGVEETGVKVEEVKKRVNKVVKF